MPRNENRGSNNTPGIRKTKIAGVDQQQHQRYRPDKVETDLLQGKPQEDKD
jgi:hypothetical protein